MVSPRARVFKEQVSVWLQSVGLEDVSRIRTHRTFPNVLAVWGARLSGAGPKSPGC